jgi:hypothetical protein
LNLVVLRSHNIERAVLFYREIGMTFTKHAHGNGPEHYSRDAGGVIFEIYPEASQPATTIGARIGFRVESVDAVIARLAAAGAQIVSSPRDSEWGRRAVVKDFDGHSVELLSLT